MSVKITDLKPQEENIKVELSPLALQKAKQTAEEKGLIYLYSCITPNGYIAHCYGAKEK